MCNEHQGCSKHEHCNRLLLIYSSLVVKNFLFFLVVKNGVVAEFYFIYL